MPDLRRRFSGFRRHPVSRTPDCGHSPKTGIRESPLLRDWIFGAHHDTACCRQESIRAPRNRPVRAPSATARHACHPTAAPCVKVLLTITTHTRAGTDVAITRPLADPRQDGADGSSLGAPADDFLVLDVVYLRRHCRMAQSKAWEQAEPVRLGSGHLISPGGTSTCRRRIRPHALIG